MELRIGTTRRRLSPADADPCPDMLSRYRSLGGASVPFEMKPGSGRRRSLVAEQIGRSWTSWPAIESTS
jgi:hypothetical protein